MNLEERWLFLCTVQFTYKLYKFNCKHTLKEFLGVHVYILMYI